MLGATESGGTARYAYLNRQGEPLGPVARVDGGPFEGIVDFHARRAIQRSVLQVGGLASRLTKRWMGTQPFYALYDGPSMSACLAGRWQEPYPRWPSSLPRQPDGLTFLDLVRPEAVVSVSESGTGTVREAKTTHYRLELDVDQIQWPEIDRSADAAKDQALASRIAVRTLPDVRPTGRLHAEAWLDDAGRLRRFSYAPGQHGRQSRWITTDIWDFGGPPTIMDWTAQAVIDPVTMAFPDSERDAMELRLRPPQ